MLHDINVLELASTMKGAYCGWLFAQAKASVRFLPYEYKSFGADVAEWLSMGKSIIEGDKADRAGIAAEVQRADVVIVDGYSDPAISGTDHVSDTNHPVIISLKDLPDEAPSSDLIVSALSGMMAINASQTSPPLREPGNQTYLVAALSGFFGACATLAGRKRGNNGRTVDTTALEAMANVLAPQVLAYSYQGDKPPREDDGRGYLFPCSDGWVSIIISSETAWTTVTQVWGITGWEDDVRLNAEKGRRRNMEAVRSTLQPYLESRKCREVFEELAAMRVVCGYAATPAMLLTDAHLTARESFVSTGTTPDRMVPRLPIRVVETRPPQAKGA